MQFRQLYKHIDHNKKVIARMTYSPNFILTEHFVSWRSCVWPFLVQLHTLKLEKSLKFTLKFFVEISSFIRKRGNNINWYIFRLNGSEKNTWSKISSILTINTSLGKSSITNKLANKSSWSRIQYSADTIKKTWWKIQRGLLRSFFVSSIWILGSFFLYAI